LGVDDFRLYGGQIVLPNGDVVFGDVGVSGGKIIEVGTPTEADLRPIDVTGLIVAPGYIDIHVNGGAGQTFEDADADGLDQILEMYARHGTTSLLGAMNTAPKEKRLDSLARVNRWRGVRTGPVDFLGVYLEGPYYNPEQRGAHQAKWMCDPNPGEYGIWLDEFGDLIRVVSLAPERDGALTFIRELDQAGIVPAVGHSMATGAVMREAIDAGVRLVTHIYNAQSTFYRHDRGKHLGVAEMGLMCDELTVEIIPDGFHLTPEMLAFILKVKATSQICATTDAMHATGLGPGKYEMMGQTVWVDGNEAFREDRNRHAGSILTMEKAVQVLVETGASVGEAVVMATEVPARTIGVDDCKGKLVKGYDADLILLDEELNVVATVCRGQVVYRSDGAPRSI
jgi:N-acetylglucosamine-6-phosphate deacetylase